MKPIIITNFKTYKQSTGKNALRLAKIHDKLAKKFKVKVMIAVQASDIPLIAKSVSIPVLAQHVDSIQFGAHTGSILPEAIKQSGASGTLLNHAEKRISFKILKKSVERCKALRLTTVVCAKTVKKAKKLAKLEPDYIAYEYQPLIGTGKSISTARPRKVKEFAKFFEHRKTIPLCGAGISNKLDVQAALELGTRGILVASAIDKAKNPENILRSFIKL